VAVWSGGRRYHTKARRRCHVEQESTTTKLYIHITEDVQSRARALGVCFQTGEHFAALHCAHAAGVRREITAAFRRAGGGGVAKSNRVGLDRMGASNLITLHFPFVPSSQVEFRVLIVGVEQCGKTSLLEKLKSLYTDAVGLPSKQIVPTVGLNIAKLEACGSKLVIWDLGGQKGLRSIWEKYYAEAHALVFVVDGGFESQDSRDTLQRILSNRKLDGAPVLVLANKSDLAGAGVTLSIRKQVESLLSQSSARTSKVLSACAHSGEGLR
jgi:ADP-ribosylation factor related protein 1